MNNMNIEKPIVDKKEINIALLGMIEGNGHPYSWSAIFNGYDKETMSKCPYNVISEYLNKQPETSFGIPGAKVTHIWTDRLEDAKLVAKASRIPNIVNNCEDVIGEVDAVIIATDDGSEHVERCRPFVEAGLPIFVDKPLVDNERDLKIFSQWVSEGAPIMSSSCMRYCKEFSPFRQSIYELGKIKYIGMSMCKSWERYGIHAIEGIYPIIGSGFVSVRNIGSRERNIVHLKHICEADVVIATIADMYGGFGVLNLHGTSKSANSVFVDTYYSFKAQLVDYVNFLKTGKRPFPFTDTQELMKIIIAGIKSRDEGGREVMLDEIII